MRSRRVVRHVNESGRTSAVFAWIMVVLATALSVAIDGADGTVSWSLLTTAASLGVVGLHLALVRRERVPALRLVTARAEDPRPRSDRRLAG